MNLSRSKITQDYQVFLRKKQEHTKHWYLDYRGLVEDALRFILKRNNLKPSYNACITECYAMRPNAPKNRRILTSITTANKYIHGREDQVKWTMKLSSSVAGLHDFLTLFGFVDFDLEEFLSKDPEENENYEVVDQEEDLSKNTSEPLVFERDTEVIGPWRIFVKEISEDKNWFKGTRITEEGDETFEKFVLGDWLIKDSNGQEEKRNNYVFSETFAEILPGSIVSLVFLQVFNDKVYAPGHVTLEPDYLMSASELSKATAGAREGQGKFIRKRFLFNKIKSSPPDAFFKGNVVNTLFDHYITSEKEVLGALRKSWMDNPMAFIYQRNKAQERFSVETAISEVQSHYHKGILQGIGEIEDVANSESSDYFEQVEPAFIQPVYGLQGRLDYLRGEIDPNGTPTYCDIIELKSSKYYGRPNPSDLDQVGYYDLLLRNIDLEHTQGQMRIKGLRKVLYPKSIDKSETVLHGYVDRDGRDTLIPFVRTQQLLNGRNLIVAMLRNLVSQTTLESFQKTFFNYLQIQNDDGFEFSWDKSSFADIRFKISSLDEIDMSYAMSQLSFGLKDNWNNAKGGSKQRGHGSSDLWLDLGSPESRLNRADNLHVDSLKTAEGLIEEICFERPSNVEARDNFKIGSSVQIRESRGTRFLQWMVLKGTIIRMSQSKITVRLANPQNKANSRLSKAETKWFLEDYYFNSTSRLFNSFDQFTSLSREKRDLLLGRSTPRVTEKVSIPHNKILEGAINAEDYFLVNGVPGAGKTTFVIRGLVEHYLSHGKRVALLTYTHKSGDRLCEALLKEQNESESICIIRDTPLDKVHPSFSHLCIESHVGEGSKEDGIAFNKWVESHNVFVGSVSSFKVDNTFAALFDYDCLIIDEASQVLEKDLLPALCWANKVVLVGDVNQLPAISAVEEEEQVSSDALNEIGFISGGISFFERMLLNAKSKNWIHAYGELLAQGRMHKEIMDLVNPMFYENKMVLRDDGEQQKSLEAAIHARTKFEKAVVANNLLFIDVNTPEYKYSKFNSTEVKWVLQAIHALVEEQIAEKRHQFLIEQVGVLVPFRAQRTEVRNALEQKYPDFDLSGMLIDTVESFQGSERENIILSFSINHEDQLEQITSVSNGKDKKLNVALTRARKRLVIFGNGRILSRFSDFHSILRHCELTGKLMYSGDFSFGVEDPIEIEQKLNEQGAPLRVMNTNHAFYSEQGLAEKEVIVKELNYGNSRAILENDSILNLGDKLKALSILFAENASRLLLHALDAYKNYFFDTIFYLGPSASEVSVTLEEFYGKGKPSTCVLGSQIPQQTLIDAGLEGPFIDCKTVELSGDTLLILPLYLLGFEIDELIEFVNRLISQDEEMDILVLKPRISWYEIEYELFINHLQDEPRVTMNSKNTVKLSSGYEQFEIIQIQINK